MQSCKVKHKWISEIKSTAIEGSMESDYWFCYWRNVFTAILQLTSGDFADSNGRRCVRAIS